jgi:uncharacterized membrane protein
MANRNPFAIIGIAIFLLTGVAVVIGVTGTLLLMLYTILGLVLGIFGVELPKLF